jgi:acyl dehydratase
MGCLGKTLVWVPGRWVNPKDAIFEVPRYENKEEEHRGLRIGQTEEKTRTFTQGDLRGFLELVDETNAVFKDRELAQALGFSDVLLPGGLLGGIVSDLLGTQLPGRGTNWLKQRYHFLNPAYPEEEITAKVEIIRLRPVKDLVNLRTTLTNQKDEVLVDGEALVLVSDLET